MDLMHNLRYDINHNPFDWWQKLKVIIAGLFPFMVNKFPRNLSFRTGVVSRLNKSLSRSYVYYEGLKKIILSTTDKEQAVLDLPRARKVLFYHIRFFNTIEKLQYFRNAETKHLCERILDNLYSIEGHLRRTVFANSDLPVNDKELREFASSVSLSSISSN